MLLKPGGYFLVYLLSTDDEYYQDMAAQTPGAEPGSFVQPVNGKFEKSFSEDEIKQLHNDLKLVELERVPKKFVYAVTGKTYNNNYIWAVFQKPA